MLLRWRNINKLLHKSVVVRGLSSQTEVPTTEAQVAAQQERNKAALPFLELVRDFLNPQDFFTALKNVGIDYFCGVPDSLLKDFCAYVTDNVPSSHHVITPNEGNAVALAAGYHLATGKSACVYLQNSGLGNSVNPLTSLTPREVYSIPMLLLIGWRGEPGKRDEPQHMVQGQLTPALLATLGIPFQILPDYQEGAESALYTAKKHLEHSMSPYAFLVKRQTFLPYTSKQNSEPRYPLSREEALEVVMSEIGPRDVVVSTTGMLSRELFEFRKRSNDGHEKDFLTVGCMGHASSIALGVALAKPNKQVWCLDGDGAAIMHLGVFGSIGQRRPSNLKHVLINNGAHDSVGGQPTDARDTQSFSFVDIAKAVGYPHAFCADKRDEIKSGAAKLRGSKDLMMMEIRTRIGARDNLGRPDRSPVQNKTDLMHFLQIC